MTTTIGRYEIPQRCLTPKYNREEKMR
jgi:hypothetical protein